MTRKDYEVIAIALAQALNEATGKEYTGVTKSIEHISHALQVAEPRFNSNKFTRFIHQEFQRMTEVKR